MPGREKKKRLRVKKASNIAASLAASGTPFNLENMSAKTLEGIISKMKKDSPLGKAASTELAGRDPKKRLKEK